MLNQLQIHSLCSAQVVLGGGGGVAGDDGVVYPLRGDIAAGTGRWVVRAVNTAITVMSVILQGRASASHPWVNVSTIVLADLNTTPAGGPAAGRAVDLWPEMRLWVETMTGTTSTLDSWIGG